MEQRRWSGPGLHVQSKFSVEPCPNQRPAQAQQINLSGIAFAWKLVRQRDGFHLLATRVNLRHTCMVSLLSKQMCAGDLPISYICLCLPTSIYLFLSSLTLYASFYSFSFILFYLFFLKTTFIIFFYSIILALSFSLFSI